MLSPIEKETRMVTILRKKDMAKPLLSKIKAITTFISRRTRTINRVGIKISPPRARYEVLKSYLSYIYH